MTRILIASLSVLAAALPLVASAQGFGRLEPPVDREDASAAAGERFDAADENGDGFLTLEEMQGAGQTPRERLIERIFERQDADADGFVSRDEAIAHAEERFDRIDTDGDGSITEEELEAARDNLRQRVGGRRG